ncbi:MAG TPA: ATP-binding protein [Candidatus Nitrosotalea sp.]|nr:ATP-binding protein [Candidatus Nitrosotalea sp.]
MIRRFLLSRFTLLSLLCIAGLALSMGLAISSLLTRAVSDWEWENTAALVRREVQINGLEAVFREPGAAGSRDRWREISRLIGSLPEVVRIKIWDPRATILWSDQEDLIGQRFPDNHELMEALQGELEVEIRSLTKAEHGSERGTFSTLAEIYVPIRSSGTGEVVGVIEVYKTPERLFATIRWAQLVIWTISIGGSVALYLVLHPLFSQIYRKEIEQEMLRRHAGQLEAEAAQRTEQLLQAQKMEAVGLLAGGIAHDFNNLLTVIMSRAGLLRRRPEATEAIGAGLALIERTAQRAATLTRQLLAFSRKQVLQPRLVDLNRVVADMVEMLRPLLGERIALSIVSSPSLGRVSADPGHLEQVIMNLAVNARDAMPDGGRLIVETAEVELDETFPGRPHELRPGPYVRLSISDTGAGIDAATQARMFEPFFTTKPPGQGTGLGLSTVYGIVKQHGGHICVESAPGRGATFRIYLPRAEAPDQPAASPTARPAPARGATILVVEDEADIRAVAAEVLRGHGYTVLEAGNGQEALRVAARQRAPLHLLLTDLVMPDLSGWELAQRLTTMRPGVQTVFMTGYSEVATDPHGRHDGPVLQKPFTPDTLLRHVHEALDAVPAIR